jgi:hypothetical protein
VFAALLDGEKGGCFQIEPELKNKRVRQAFTHLALISAATYLDRALSGNDESVWR